VNWEHPYTQQDIDELMSPVEARTTSADGRAVVIDPLDSMNFFGVADELNDGTYLAVFEHDGDPITLTRTDVERLRDLLDWLLFAN
jgi:hypothetical protein